MDGQGRRGESPGGRGSHGRGEGHPVRSGDRTRRTTQPDFQRMDPVERTLATNAGRAAIGSIEKSKRNQLFSVGGALVLSGCLGWLTFRKSSTPSARSRPRSRRRPWGLRQGGAFTESPMRSARWHVRWRAEEGAAEMEAQRWIKSHAAHLTGDLQAVSSLKEFGERLAAGWCPCSAAAWRGFMFPIPPRGVCRALQAMAWRKHPRRRTLSPWEKAWSANARRIASPSRSPRCPTATAALSPAWAKPRRYRRPPGRCSPSRRCWACSSSPRYIPLPHVKTRCWTRSYRWRR